VIGLVLVGCSTAADQPAGPGQSSPQPLTQADLRWLNRVTFGVDSATVTRYQKAGRIAFLDEQLRAPLQDPPDLATAIGALTIAQQSAERLFRAVLAEERRINTLPNEDEKQRARTALDERGKQVAYETAKRHLMRALYSPAQLREQMTWFWMNHFSVYVDKASVRWTLGEYEERAVRAHALGKFHALVLATVKAPAMLDYLDNAQSAAGHLNENYARELLELHTLGLGGGASGSRYSQYDVQELARVLTGVGINATNGAPGLPPWQQSLYMRDGLFEFNPARHDFGAKAVLGRLVPGAGFAEAEQAVALLSQDPATARFISRKLATYFVADDPPTRLVDTMAETFRRSDGDIAMVLRVLFSSPELATLLAEAPAGAGKFKDPLQFVVSSLRLAYDGKVISNYKPVISWLSQLGEPLYGRVTPDGYALVEPAWTSPGQLVKRFEIARAIGAGSADLFNTDDNQLGPRVGVPTLKNGLFHEAIEPTLSVRTREVLGRTVSEQEWNTVLLASPDWMQR